MELSLLNLFLVLLAGWLGGQLALKLGYPTVLGEILAGVILGPPLLGLLYGTEALAVLAEVGILLMMLYIGMEIDPKELGKASKGGLLAALGGFIVPFILGYWVVGIFGGTKVAGLFVGMAMGVTSLATKSRILVDLNILNTRISHVMLAGALIADTLSLIIFAGILSFATADSFNAIELGIIGVKVVIFFFASWILGVKVFPPFYQFLKEKDLTGRTFNATLILLITLGFAELAHLAGLHGILGAFIAGLFLREAMAEKKLSHELTGLIKDVSLGFLAPIFFVTAGFQVSFSVFQNDLALLVLVIVLATFGKIIGTALFYIPSGNGWREGLTIGAGMNGRGAVEIVIAGIGLKNGIIDQTIFSILVFMAIATTTTVPVFLRWGVNWLESRSELVRSSSKKNIIIAGAGVFARFVASKLSEKSKVTLIDTNEDNVLIAKNCGFDVIHGDAIDEEVLYQAGIEEAGKILALTPNSEVNALILKRAFYEYYVPNLYAVLDKTKTSGLQNTLKSLKAKILFPSHRVINKMERHFESHEQISLSEIEIDEGTQNIDFSKENSIPVFLKRGEEFTIFDSDQELIPKDKILTFNFS